MTRPVPDAPAGTPATPAWTDSEESPAQIASFARRVGGQQRKLAAAVPELAGKVGHGQHQRQLLGAFGELRLPPRLPADVRHGPFVESAVYPVACRVSNGQPCRFDDHAPDVRGIAVKFFAAGDVETDLVMTNEGGRSHARDATQFMKVADLLADLDVVSAGRPSSKLRGLGYLLADALRRPLRPQEAVSVAGILGRETVLRAVDSMATERYWGSVVLLGDRPAKYSVRPHASTPAGTAARRSSPDYLREDLVNRLLSGPLRFEVCVQLFADEERTPVRDASVAWQAPPIPVGVLELPRLPEPRDEELVDAMAFNPVHGFPPLGITHARGAVYEASARNRGALRTEDVRPLLVDGPERPAPARRR
jgi:hypothetical protein